MCPQHKVLPVLAICGSKPNLCNYCISQGWTAHGGTGGIYIENTTTGERSIISVEKRPYYN